MILWAIVERRKALSSSTTEDAVAYRAFLCQASPRARWVAPTVARSSVEWRPFAGLLSARSIAYALSLAGAVFRWLIQQRYCLANPFPRIKVRGVSAAAPQALQRAFGEGEWAVNRVTSRWKSTTSNASISQHAGCRRQDVKFAESTFLT